jgi:hypothetical protein
VNVALPVLVFLYLVVPGVLLVQAYRGRLGRKASDPAYPVALTSGLLWAAALVPLIHLLLSPLVKTAFDVAPAYSHVLYLLSGNYDNEAHFSRARASIVNYPLHVAGYFYLSALLATALGFAGHRLARRFRLDVKYPSLRFPNSWHYLFSGELAGDSVPAGVLITTTVHHPEGGYLYVGILTHHEVDRDGDLVRLELANAHRRAITADRKPGEEQQTLGSSSRYYRITGDVFVIWCKDVQTLNITYLYETDDQE